MFGGRFDCAANALTAAPDDARNCRRVSVIMLPMLRANVTCAQARNGLVELKPLRLCLDLERNGPRTFSVF